MLAGFCGLKEGWCRMLCFASFFSCQGLDRLVCSDSNFILEQWILQTFSVTLWKTDQPTHCKGSESFCSIKQIH